jgi:hypothetical protein
MLLGFVVNNEEVRILMKACKEKYPAGGVGCGIYSGEYEA